jgi:hypothetical protein
MRDSRSIAKYFFILTVLLCGILALTSCSNNIDYTFQAPQENIEVDIWTDSFTQVGSYENMDIIWVIDDSCSMADNDTELLAGIEAMMNNLPPDMDWRLKMITAGAYGPKQSTTFPLTQGATYKDALYMYSELPYDGGEAGFTSVQNYVLYDTYAQTWLRNDAALLVVFVSDEEEQSSMTVSEFTIWYRATRETVYMASIVNIDPAQSLCSYHFTSTNTGFRYMSATNNFNGNIIDICSSDWSAGVQEATSELQPSDSLNLSHLPWEDTIVVFEDGTPHSDWYYNSLDNTVYLNAIPAEGSLVEVSYSIEEYLIEPTAPTALN